jgi:hypothetical protein
MVDRSKCKRCAENGIETILTPDNAYARSDTHNKLHVYCKTCYLEIQKERTRSIAANNKKYTLLVSLNGGRSQHRIYFDTFQEKRDFITTRKLQGNWYRDYDAYCSIIGGAALESDRETCDECGGMMRYDEHHILCCETCGLVSDDIPFYVERGKVMAKGRHAWNGKEADRMCQDSYYSTAYSRF